MSPVRKTNPRAVIFAVGTFAVGAILVLGLFVFAVGRATESGNFEVKLGSDTFDAGDSQLRADTIAQDGPLLFSDVAGGQRDIFLQHEGTDAATGWLAFDVRKAGESRDCQLVWDRDAKLFRDSCDKTTVPANGEGLTHYPVEVDANKSVIVNLNADRPRPTTTTTTAPEETTTTRPIIVTPRRQVARLVGHSGRSFCASKKSRKAREKLTFQSRSADPVCGRGSRR